MLDDIAANITDRSARGIAATIGRMVTAQRERCVDAALGGAHHRIFLDVQPEFGAA